MKAAHVSFRILSFIIILIMLVSSGAPALGQSNASDPSQRQTNGGMVVAKIYYHDKADLDQLAGTLDIWQVNTEAGYAVVMLSTEMFATLEQAGYHLVIDQKQTDRLSKVFTPLPGQDPNTIPSFPCYRTVEETYSAMQLINTQHPSLAAFYDIGDSWARIHLGFPNGYDIVALRLTNENFGDVNQKPTFFLMAEIHARELVTAETAMRYAEYLINNYGINPDITWLLDYFRVFIVTMTNPDGRKIAETGQLWRKNVDNDDGCTNPSTWGVDLNRNHSFHWLGTGSSPYACDETYRGPSEASEPEVQAIQSFVLGKFPDQRGPGDTDPAPLDATGTFITLHSAAGLVLWPWGFTYTPAPNDIQLATLGRHLAYFNEYTPQQSVDLYPTNGTSDDWAYGILGVASYTFEMGTDFFQDCGSFENTIYPKNRDALLYAFKTARRPYMNPDGPDTLNVVASPTAAAPGDTVLLNATANGTRFGGSGEPIHNITQARYSIDNPSWINGTTTYPMTAADGDFNQPIENITATINTTGLSSGRHTIFVESKNANNWGVISAVFIYVIEPGVSPVIQGYVLESGTNAPLTADVTAGLFSTTTDPATGYYSMTVVSGSYNIVATADNHAPAYANGVVAQDYQIIQQDFTLFPICNVFSDTVENGNQGWISQPSWAITTEASHSSNHSWTDSPGGNYGNNRNTSLTSKVFNLSETTGVTLDYWQSLITEAGWDYCTVEYSTNGSTWNIAAIYDGNHPSWTEENIALPGLDGQANARIRFRFTSDSNTVYDGWHIDDVNLTAGGPICNPPSVEFSSNSPVPEGQPVQFDNLTTGPLPITYLWAFGDGGTSTTYEPTHTYPATGTYTVTLTASNSGGSSSINHAVMVTPIAISGVTLTKDSPDPVHNGDVVDFSADLLPNNAFKPYTYTVSFGDGISTTGASSADPLTFNHVYYFIGDYTIQISVINDAMTVPITDSLSLPILTRPDPAAEFSSNSPIFLSQPMQFTNLSTGLEPLNFIWHFGDGIGTSTESNPAYTYSAAGTYTVTLVATNTLGTDSIMHAVHVEPSGITSVDLSQTTPTPVFAGEAVNFLVDLKPDEALKPYTYTVNYGDGTVVSATSNDDPFSLNHHYDSGGSYIVTISISNAGMTEPVASFLNVNISFRRFMPIAFK